MKARFFVSDQKPSRAGAVKAGRLLAIHPQGLALTVPSTAAPSNAVGLGQQDDDQRGARIRARIYRATTLYSVGPRTRTMMQILCRRSGRKVLSARCQRTTRCIGETLMEARTVNNLPPAASHDDDAVRCVLAVELSKKSWIVAVNTPLSDKIGRLTLKPCDGKQLLDLCERIRTRVARETKQRVEIVSCYEAGYDGFWLHRLLEAHGIRNYVIDPA